MAAVGARVGPMEVAALGRALDEAVVRSIGRGGRCTVLFSGGIDSGLVAAVALRNGHPELLTIGVKGSQDLGAVVGLPEEWTRPLRRVEVTPEEVGATAARIGPILEGATPLERTVAVSFAVALSQVTLGPVLVGQGADELFLGYAHFRGLGPSEALARSESDLTVLVEREWPRARQIGKLLGFETVAPFLDPAVIDAGRSFPVEQRMPGAETKRPLRALARSLGVPESICARPKKAIQYSTGIERTLRHQARQPA